MTRRQRDEYDKKIAGALRKYLSEEGLSEAADAAAARPKRLPMAAHGWKSRSRAQKQSSFSAGSVVPQPFSCSC